MAEFIRKSYFVISEMNQLRAKFAQSIQNKHGLSVISDSDQLVLLYNSRQVTQCDEPTNGNTASIVNQTQYEFDPLSNGDEIEIDGDTFNDEADQQFSEASAKIRQDCETAAAGISDYGLHISAWDQN
jgi:hypothetical protein